MNELTEHYKRLYRDQDLNIEHSNYLKGIKDVLNYEPKVIYDIGSAVLWWTKAAKTVWPQAHVLAFEAVLELKEFYDSVGIDYALEVCSDVDDKEVIFYEHPRKILNTLPLPTTFIIKKVNIYARLSLLILLLSVIIFRCLIWLKLMYKAQSLIF